MSQSIRTAGHWAHRFVRGTDLLALGALMATSEVRTEVVFFVGALAIVSRLWRRTTPLPERYGVLALAVALLTAGTWALTGKMHPIVAAANAAPITHALLWLAPSSPRYLGWRIGVGFIDLVLASALTVELFLPVAIFLFAILAAITLSCSFLDVEFRKHRLPVTEQILPSSYLARSLFLALSLFLSAGIIFPLLPRQTWQGAGFAPQSTVGYTEEVELDSDVPSQEPGSGAVLARIFVEESETLDRIFQPGRFGYLRGAPLELFDGKKWQKSFARFSDRNVVPVIGKPIAALLSVKISREKLNTDTIPVPLGTLSVSRLGGGEPRALANASWVDRAMRFRRTTYQVNFRPGLNAADSPSPLTLDPHPLVRRSRLAELIQPLRLNQGTPLERLRSIDSFFRNRDFRASLEPDPDLSSKNPIEVLERFLFETRSGHCERFAASATLLLRLAGVPARMVAGFRISRPSLNGVIAVREGDAHAWVEAWIPGQGWVPFDPTPRILAEPQAFDWLKDAYEVAGTWWYRYVLAYSEGSEGGFSLGDLTLSRSQRSGWMPDPRMATEFEWGLFLGRTLPGLALTLLSAWLVYLRRSMLRSWLHWLSPCNRYRPPLWLLQERLAMDQLLQRQRLSEKEHYPEWHALYQEARFGPPKLSSELRYRLRAARRSPSTLNPSRGADRY